VSRRDTPRRRVGTRWRLSTARAPSFYATILGSPDRATRTTDLTKLLRWGLARFRRVPVIRRDRVYARVDVGYRRAKVDLVPQAQLVRAIRIDEPLVERTVATAVATLPVHKGQWLGWIRVYQGGRLLGREPLVASRAVTKPGVLARVGFYAEGTGRHIWSWLH